MKQADVGLWLGRARGRFRPEASTTYRRGLGDRRTMATLELSGLGNGLFVVDGLPLAQDTFVGRAGLTLQTQSVRVSLACTNSSVLRANCARRSSSRWDSNERNRETEIWDMNTGKRFRTAVGRVAVCGMIAATFTIAFSGNVHAEWAQVGQSSSLYRLDQYHRGLSGGA